MSGLPRTIVSRSSVCVLASGALLTALIFGPAVVRAAQALQPGPIHASGGSGLHKSADAPPEPVHPAADMAVSPRLEPVRPVTALARLDRATPPPSLHLSNADSLRAPPRAPLA